MRILLPIITFSFLLLFTQCTEDIINPDYLEIGNIETEGLFFHEYDSILTVGFTSRFDSLRVGFDLNHNGEKDVFVETYQEWSAIHSMYRASLVTDNFYIALHDSIDSPIVLQIGDKIDNSLRWSQGRFNLVYYYGADGGIITSSGLWFNTDKNYAGIKFDDGETVRYGWICLDYIYKEIRVYNFAFLEI